jgi:hypothetical protein
MDALPTDRNFVSFAAMTPGVFVTGVSQNVGGSIPETGMNLVVHGSRAADSLIMVDGMSIINGSGSGGLQYGNYLNNSLAQEITFQTAGNSAEFERASVVSNFIPKEGSNTFRVSFQTRFTNQSLESNNLAPHAFRRPEGANLANKIFRDLNPSAGPDPRSRVISAALPSLGRQQRRRVVQGRRSARRSTAATRTRAETARRRRTCSPWAPGAAARPTTGPKQGPRTRTGSSRKRRRFSRAPDGHQRVPSKQNIRRQSSSQLGSPGSKLLLEPAAR